MAEPATEIVFEYKNKRFKDAAVGLAYFSRDLSVNFEREAVKALKIELKWFLQGVIRALETRHAGNWPGGTTPNTLSRRSGGAMDSLYFEVNKARTIKNLQARIGGKSWLKVHEFGTVGKAGTLPDIVPVRATYLTVPLPAALDSRGVPLKASARDWENTFRWDNPNTGKKFIATKGADGKLVLLYILLTVVSIPARLGMRKTLEAGKSFLIDRAIDRIRTNVMKKTRTAKV